jgi:enoyl-[acyl-carrier protein] reductase II
MGALSRQRLTPAAPGAIVRAGGSDTAVTPCFSGKPMRVIRNAYVEDWEKRSDEIQPFPAQMTVSARAGVFGLTSGDAERVDPARSCMPAGQGVGGIDEILPAGEIVRRVMDEARAAIERMGKLL